MNIRDLILARPELGDMHAARDLDGLAAALNAQPAQELQPRFVTARTVLAECADGSAILDALTAAAEHVSAVKWALNFLGKDSGLDVGNPATQGMIDQLVGAGALTADQAAELKSLAVQPVLVTRDQVNGAMYNPDGTEK